MLFKINKFTPIIPNNSATNQFKNKREPPQKTQISHTKIKRTTLSLFIFKKNHNITLFIATIRRAKRNKLLFLRHDFLYTDENIYTYTPLYTTYPLFVGL